MSRNLAPIKVETIETRIPIATQPVITSDLPQLTFASQCWLCIPERWDWAVALQTREPACRLQLLQVLEQICRQPQLKGGAK